MFCTALIPTLYTHKYLHRIQLTFLLFFPKTRPVSLGRRNSYQSLRPNLHLNCWPTPSSIIRQHSWILSREIIFPACWWSGLWDPLIHISRISANRKIILYHRYLTSGSTDWKSFKTSENDLCDNSQSFFQLPVWRRKREVDFISDFPFCKN